MKKGFANVGLILIVLVLIALGGYFVWEKQTTTVKQVATVNTSDWQTYTNTQYGFEMGYPSTVVAISTEPSGHVLYSGSITIEGELLDVGPYVIVPTKNDEQKKSIQAWMNEFLQLADSHTKNIGDTPITCQRLDIPNPYNQVDAVHCNSSAVNETFGLIKNADTWVFFHSTSDIPKSATSNEELKTLSTFKFTGSTTAPVSTGEKIIRKVGEREGSFLVQKINSSSALGLWYQAYPVATSQGTPKTLYIGDDIGYACEGVSEKLTSIDVTGQTVTFTKVTSKPPLGGCPI